MWRAYIKDITDLSSVPKAFLKVTSCQIEQDALVSTTSTIYVLEVPDNVNTGDVIVLHNEEGIVRFNGVIKDIKDNSLECKNIQSLFSDKDTYAPIPSVTITPSSSKQWNVKVYGTDTDYPTEYDTLENELIYETNINHSSIYVLEGDVEDASTMAVMKCYMQFSTTHSYTGSNKLIYYASRSGTLTINGELISTSMYKNEQGVESGYGEFEYTFEANKVYEIVACINNKNEMKYTFGIFSMSGSTAVMFGNDAQYIRPSATHYLESSIKETLKRFASGRVCGGSYVDTLRALELGSITFSNSTDNQGQLEFKKINTNQSYEDLIYSVFDKYNIMVDIAINYSSYPSINVFKPNYTQIKIGNNSSIFKDFSPITKVEETNKLIIYTAKGVYRTTYMSKTDGTSVEQPSSYANRFNQINTKTVYSNEDVSKIIANNLPTKFYNHKLTFSMRLKNGIFEFDDLKIGTPIEVFIDGDYYSTMITSYKYTKDENQDVNEVEFTCGKVRTSLTKKLAIGVMNA